MDSTERSNTEEVAVRRLVAEGSEIAVFEFQGQMRDLMVSNLRSGYLAMGTYAEDAKTLSPQGALSLVVAGAATTGTALSASLSSTLFVATANPATLMQLGSGVGSAVMGASGIVGQAAFIPVASALPIVAPLMAMHVLNSVVMLQQFQQVDRKLDGIKSTLDKAIARSEATFAGELMTASRVVDEVYRQYEEAGAFSNDMLIRLALAERDVRRLAERFRYLVGTHSTAEVDDIADVQRANYDAHSAMLASFLDLRVAYLRVCVDMQENAKSVSTSVKQLKDQILVDSEFWEQMLQRSQTLRDAISERETQLSDMNWVKRFLPEFAGGRGAAVERNIAAMRDAYVSTLESELAITKGFDSLIHSAKRTLEALDSPQASLGTTPTVVYWQDEEGEHSFVTEKLQLS